MIERASASNPPAGDGLRVALDVTHARLNRTGLGRYPAELEPALRRQPALDVVPVSAVRQPAGMRAGRIVQGLMREGVYYPRLLAARALAAGADLVHCATPAPVRGGRLPLVVTVHDVLPLRLPHLFPRTTVLHTRLSLAFLRGAARVLTNSEYTKSDLVDATGLDDDRVVATPFGVHDRFRPKPPERSWLAERFSIDGRYVLTVGTLEPRKNLVGALRAFAHVRREHPDVELVVVGGAGWRNEAFEAAVRDQAAGIHLTGFVSDDELVALYSGTACFLFPSLAEGFGFPPLEAMACGAPVVAGDRTALPEVLGDAALLVDPEDPEALADAVTRVLGSGELADDLRRQGLHRAAARRWDACAAATRAAYAAAVAGA